MDTARHDSAESEDRPPSGVEENFNLDRPRSINKLAHMRLNKEQISILSKYLSDLSKVIFASIVIGYFIPVSDSSINTITFIAGIMAMIGCVIISLRLLMTEKIKN